MIAGIIDNDTGNLPFEKKTDRKLAENEDRPQIDPCSHVWLPAAALPDSESPCEVVLTDTPSWYH